MDVPTYTVTVTGRFVTCYNVWEHTAGKCFQRFIGHSWEEAEEFITSVGGVVPERPEWAKLSA